MLLPLVYKYTTERKRREEKRKAGILKKKRGKTGKIYFVPETALAEFFSRDEPCCF